MCWTPFTQEIKVIAGSAPISVLRNHPLVSFRHVIWKKSFGHPSQKKIKFQDPPPAIVSQRQRKLHNTRCLVLS